MVLAVSFGFLRNKNYGPHSSRYFKKLNVYFENMHNIILYL